MSLFLADGAPGMSCVTTPRVAAVVVRSRIRSRVLLGARAPVLGPPTAVGRVVCGGGITMHPSRQDVVGLGRRAPDIVSALPA